MITRSSRHWRASHLLGAWVAYWVALLAVWFARPVLAAWRVKDAPPGTSQATVSFGDRGIVARIVMEGRTLVDQHASLGAILLWLTVPPLILFLLWLRSGSARERAREAR
jgi:hypothetical protein